MWLIRGIINFLFFVFVESAYKCRVGENDLRF